jgi:hypothetical protein
LSLRHIFNPPLGTPLHMNATAPKFPLCISLAPISHGTCFPIALLSSLITQSP